MTSQSSKITKEQTNTLKCTESTLEASSRYYQDQIGMFECVYNPKITKENLKILLNNCKSTTCSENASSSSENSGIIDAAATSTGRNRILIIPTFINLKEGSGSDIDAVIRKGQRGGLLSKLNRNYFFTNPVTYPESTRMWQEFYLLNFLRGRGVWVPEPLFAAVKSLAPGIYTGYLGTIHLSGTKNFLDILTENPLPSIDSICNTAFLTGREAKKALSLGILHSDLHIGNILVGKGSVYLIDFDKSHLSIQISRNCDISKQFEKTVANISFIEKGEKSLLNRWVRSVEKRVVLADIRSVLIKSFKAGLET
ncbi:MAG TPA: lipopolysaccharide kinase InaA family protein [Oligoflexia bacterium]|nr:lipopolysaccharide kinase InaA family protein [Oligoflexia bacterium]HMP47373.1 lipopolysaccharide kinase InaA family protein [Oligoflexia bacterium]